MTQERHTKIAVIGAAGPRHESGEARVEWFPWTRLKNLENLADYDIVILDLLSITDQTLQDRETFDSVLNEKSMLEGSFSQWQRQLSLLTESLLRKPEELKEYLQVKGELKPRPCVECVPRNEQVSGSSPLVGSSFSCDLQDFFDKGSGKFLTT